MVLNVYMMFLAIECIMIIGYAVSVATVHNFLGILIIFVGILNGLKGFYEWDREKPNDYNESEEIYKICIIKGFSLFVLLLATFSSFYVDSVIQWFTFVFVVFVLCFTDMDVKFYK